MCARGLLGQRHCTGSPFVLTFASNVGVATVSYRDKDTLFIFLDESGNLDFSSSGTKYFSLTAVCTFLPTLGRQPFYELLYEMCDAGNGQECFHATEDKQEVRDAVFERIAALADGFEIHSIIAEKRKAHPSLYRKWVFKKDKKVNVKDASKFYDFVCGTLLGYIFRSPGLSRAGKIVVVLSYLFDKPKNTALEASLRIRLRNDTKLPFCIYFHQTKADMNCQIADYCGWAVTIKWERGERRSYELITTHLKSEFDVFRRGDIYHY